MTSETQLKQQPMSVAVVWHLLVTLSIYVRWGLKCTMMASFFVSMRIFWLFIPDQRRGFLEVLHDLSGLKDTKLTLTDWGHTFFSWRHYKSEARRMLLDSYKNVRLHGPANNVDVITLEGNAAKLLDYSSDPERPLVVNFGSCT